MVIPELVRRLRNNFTACFSFCVLLPGSATRAGILIMLGWHPAWGAEKQETGLGAVLQLPPRSLWKCFVLEDTRETAAFVPRLLPGVNQGTRVALLQRKT